MSARVSTLTPEQRKTALRTVIRAQRLGMTTDDRARSAAGIADQLDALLQKTAATSVACYLSLTTEPGTREFLARRHDGLRILLPATREDGLLDWIEAGPVVSEDIGPHGVPEPVGHRLPPAAIDDVDLLFIPAAAVDEGGMRLGWGRGYYDRTIGGMPERRPIYAILHDAELVPEVPREPHDQPVTGVVTPTRTIVFPSETNR